MAGSEAPMGDPSSFDGGMEQGNPNEEMPDDNMGQEPQNQFDTDFDAGVDADEEKDPKTYIQQLTGKLSTSLNKYNEQLPQPDADLSKYVAGMIVKQAVKGLSEKDTNEILNKVKPEDEGGSEGEDKTLDDIDADSGEETPTPEMNESKKTDRILKDKKALIREMFQELNQSPGIERGGKEGRGSSKVDNKTRTKAKDSLTSNL